MTVDGQNPERRPEGVEISPEAAEARKAVIEKLNDKRDEMIESVKEAFDERISFGGDQTSEQAKDRIIFIRDRQIAEITRTYDELVRDFEKRISGDSSLDMNKLADELLKDANDTARRRLEQLKVVLAKKIEGAFMTTAEVAAIEKAVTAIELFDKDHPELHALFVKIGEGGNLTPEEYAQVINLMNPADLGKIGVSGPEAFETTASGLLIGVMSPAQRFELVKRYMESDKKENTAQLIDAFLKTGVLSLMQGEELFKLAVSAGALSSEEFESEYKKKLESAYYADELKKFREAVGGETARDIGGRFSRNVVERFVGKPLLHTLLMLWGGTTMLVNALASREKGNFAQSLKNIADNKFFWLGAGAAGVGYEGATGTMRDGRGRGGALDFFGLGEGNISAWLDKMLSDEDREDVVKRNALKLLAENYLGAPPAFRDYLENGGHATIMKFKDEKDARGNPVMSLEKMLEKEEGAVQKGRLEELKSMNGEPGKRIDKMLLAVAVSASALGIDESKETLESWLKKIRETQLPSS